MRLLAAAHVRNEADIVEAFVRHNLALLDGIAIVDHMSVDETPDILRELKAEGLPIFIAQDTSPAFDQQLMTNRLVRHLFATTEAAWVFPLDADEFLRARAARSRKRWRLARRDGMGDVRAGVRHATALARRNAPAARRRPWAAQGRGLAQFGTDPDPIWSKDSIGGIEWRPVPRDARRAAAATSVVDRARAHSSAHQFTAKVALGWLSNLRVPVREPNESLHRKEAFETCGPGGR
jgi:hypothetical protein